MEHLERPSTSCSSHRPSLTDNEQADRSAGKTFMSRSYTFYGDQAKNEHKPKHQQQLRIKSTSRPSRSATDYQTHRSTRSLLNKEQWQQETKNDARLNTKVIDQSDQNVLYGKGTDPLPHVREILTELSNAEALLYARQCRVVVAKLRFCWGDLNDEIKSLLKHKEYTEAAVDHIRKDLIVNRESFGLRKKPKREAAPDATDDVLVAEKYHLTNMKTILELNCKNIVDQMQSLDEVRQRVTKLSKERSVVTELICQCLTSASKSFEAARTRRLEDIQARRVPAPTKHRPASAMGARTTGIVPDKLLRAHSNLNLTDLNSSAEGALLDDNGLPYVGPLLAFLPDVIEVFQDASKLIEESREIKSQAINQIKDAFVDSKSYSATVNESLAQKLGDITILVRNLSLSLGENKLAQNRAARWYDLTMSAQRSNAGPISASCLSTAERPDRPILRTFQRHPANQVPDAQLAAKATMNLQQSAEETQKQIKALKVVGQRLRTNLADKEMALNIDAHLLRRRRERSDHKWGVSKYVHV